MLAELPQSGAQVARTQPNSTGSGPMWGGGKIKPELARLERFRPNFARYEPKSACLPGSCMGIAPRRLLSNLAQCYQGTRRAEFGFSQAMSKPQLFRQKSCARGAGRGGVTSASRALEPDGITTCRALRRADEKA